MNKQPQAPARNPKRASNRNALLLAGISSVASIGFATPALAGTMVSFDQLANLAIGAAPAQLAAVTSVAAASAASELAKADPGLAPASAASALPASPAASGALAQLANVRISVPQARINPVLSVGLVGAERNIQRGKPASFLGFSNYPAFVARAELRILNAGLPTSAAPVAILAANGDGVAQWTPDAAAPQALSYVYRVYDRHGHFDETAPQPLNLLSAAHVVPAQSPARPDFGQLDSAAMRQIGLANAAPVAVSGLAHSLDSVVRVSGLLVPADAAGRFHTEQLVPATCQTLAISVTDSCGTTATAQLALATPAASDGMAITIDPQDQPLIANPYQIKIRNDATHINPVLAIGLVDAERSVVRGKPATFISYTNYPSFITRRELRIFAAKSPADAAPLTIIAANPDGVVRWTPDQAVESDLAYVYRVYDSAGHFDETAPQELQVLGADFTPPAPPPRPLFGTRDEAVIRNIAFAKAITVTVTGTATPAEEVVRVAGQMVPIEADGRFVSQQIVARDARQLWVTIGHGEQARFTAMRDIDAPRHDWFVVGQGDLTFVANRSTGPAVEVSGDPLASGDHLNARAAFYAKGSLANGWKVTTSLDTGEALLGDLFSNIDRKDPNQLLRRMNANQFYTTYGDDSTLVEDAPTQGRFYFKAQKAKSSFTVGNFITDIRQTDLAQLSRGVFGVIADHKSLAATSFGESKLQLTAFASDPGTVPGRDELRGTGGSLYYLNRRDLTVGSERLSIEVRDRDTGLVLSRRDLRAQEDYDIDYFQGRVTLLTPLASAVSDGALVRDGASSGHVPVLVARYEYTPAVGDISGYTLGGRAAAWLGDTLRLGVTSQRENTGGANQTLVATDATLRLHAGTYVKAEIAATQGPGFGQANSVDGGLSFANQPGTGTPGTKSRAWRSEFAVDFAEMQGRKGDLGKASAYYEQRAAGFGATGQLTNQGTKRWGASLALPLGAATTLSAKIQRLATDSIGQRTVGSAEIAQKLGGGYDLSVGLRHDAQTAGLPGTSAQTGQRSDLALQLGYAPALKRWAVHAFGQATLDRDATRQANNRGGIGGKIELGDRATLSGEISDGNGGLGAKLDLNHRFGQGSEAYLGYTLVSDRTDIGLDPGSSLGRTNAGTLVVGARQRYSSSLALHSEEKIGQGGTAPSVMHAFGFDYSPSKRWSVTGSLENGHIDDVQTGLFRRTAFSLGTAYTSKTAQFATHVEGRFERGSNRDQNVWLFRNHGSLLLTPDWRAIGQLNFAIADTNTADISAADFIDGSIGFAYRPVRHERLNVLARYTYLADMGPVGQITQGGTTGAPKQKSRIFAIDANYDLTSTLTIGGKYAIRSGSVSLGRNSDVFVSSSTQLGVLRADWRLVKSWDVMVEGHYLSTDQSGDHRLGGMAAIYRHVGTHMKIGVGYSFSDFSSDLGDQSYSSKGLFLNLLGKF